MTSASIVTATTIAVPLKKIFQNSESFSSVKPSSIIADDERAQHRPEHRPGAAEDVDAADHDRGDDVELEVRTRRPRSTFAKRAANMNPPRPASAPLIANASITRRPTGMPE